MIASENMKFLILEIEDYYPKRPLKKTIKLDYINIFHFFTYNGRLVIAIK